VICSRVLLIVGIILLIAGSGNPISALTFDQDGGFARGYINDQAEHVLVVARIGDQEYLGGIEADDPEYISFDGAFRAEFRLKQVVEGDWNKKHFSAKFIAHTYFKKNLKLLLLINKNKDGEYTIRAYDVVHKGRGCLPKGILEKYGLSSKFNLKPPNGYLGICVRA